MLNRDLGYYSHPAIFGQQVVFVSDDDLWSVYTSGGRAQRLTSGLGVASQPLFSPNGEWIAFIANDSGVAEVYLIPAQGGVYRKLTHQNVRGLSQWKDNATLVVISGHECWASRDSFAYELNVNTLEMKKLNWGVASTFQYGPKGSMLLGRYNGDSARWKRYRGGTAGRIWLKKSASEKFQLFLNRIQNQLSFPQFIGEHIYFVSDFEGVANLYRCDFSQRGLKRLTHHKDYYVRSFKSDGENLVYQCGAEIYLLNLNSLESQKLEIECPTTAAQTRERYEPALAYLDSLALHPFNSEFTMVARGHSFRVPTFNGPVEELGARPDNRYSHVTYSVDGSLILMVGSNSEHDEKLFVFNTKTSKLTQPLPKFDLGKVWSLRANPKNGTFAIANHRQELFIFDSTKNTIQKIDATLFSRCSELTWSPDGRYLAYSTHFDANRTGLKIYDAKKKSVRALMEPVLHDSSPSFDPEGKYLYFMSVREFYPNYNETHFDLGFPFAGKPYAVSLRKDIGSPFEAHLENPREKNSEESKNRALKKKSKEASAKKELSIEIDFDEIEKRVMGFPLPVGGYGAVIAIKGGILYFRKEVAPITHFDWRSGEGKGLDLHAFRFEENNSDLMQANVKYFTVNRDHTHMLIYASRSLRLIDVRSRPSNDNKVGRKDGWIDSTRLRLRIDPLAEWRQMYREAWVLQREHFWRSDMNKIEWTKVYTRYWPLLERVKTRAELSDLLWEMQGELGTSHCYEFGGDYVKSPPYYAVGYLGGEFSFDARKKMMKITRLFKGDSWIKNGSSPLTAAGVSLKVGDEIYAVNKQEISSYGSFFELLENKAGHKVELKVKRVASSSRKAKTKDGFDYVIVTVARSHGVALYREWVESNKEYVHKKSAGRVGYVHIPDMGPYGYAEFYRHYIAESRFDALIVDVRYNGGGHVSQHLLKVLAQRVLGFDVARYHGLTKYPNYAINGPIVALTNEMAGSDGDIFSHSFKMMKLGPLIGKRTWGGVIGINGQYSLRDGTITTQPEFSTWFQDVEWNVENYGTDPDIEVDYTPEDYRQGSDPQLDRALLEIEKALKKAPPLKLEASYYPDLSLPNELVLKKIETPTKKKASKRG